MIITATFMNKVPAGIEILRPEGQVKLLPQHKVSPIPTNIVDSNSKFCPLQILFY